MVTMVTSGILYVNLSDLYRAYNDFITRKLNELGITIPFRKRKFDHFVLYKNG